MGARDILIAHRATKTSWAALCVALSNLYKSVLVDIAKKLRASFAASWSKDKFVQAIVQGLEGRVPLPLPSWTQNVGAIAFFKDPVRNNAIVFLEVNDGDCSVFHNDVLSGWWEGSGDEPSDVLLAEIDSFTNEKRSE